MTIDEVVRTYRKYQLPAKKMILSSNGDMITQVTKIGGTPWWPRGTGRPACERGHYMTFIAQFNLADLPNNNGEYQGLCSFHYCHECMFDGCMSFGWIDQEHSGYDVRIFTNLNQEGDANDIVSNDKFPNYKVKLEEIIEVPALEDLPAGFANSIPDEFFNYIPPDYDAYSPVPSDYLYNGLMQIKTSKIGGAPIWLQHVQWPASTQGERMRFLAQLDYIVGSESAWAAGNAYLFFIKNTDNTYDSEMLIQTT